MAPAPMPSPSLIQDLEPILDLRDASKVVVEGVNRTFPAFRNLSLKVYPGERLAVFGVNGAEARSLVACLSGVEPLDSGSLDQGGSVSWPMGTNDAFSGKLSGYVNARFAAEVYSQPGEIEADLQLIQELADIPETVYHKPFGDWPAALKDSLRLAVSLAFAFDVVTVARLAGWDHRAIHPRAVRIRECFEQRIDGRTLVVCANGQNGFALDYCERGLALVDGLVVYEGDPEICLELVKEEAKRQKQQRRQRINRRVSRLVGVDDPDAADGDDELGDDLGDEGFADDSTSRSGGNGVLIVGAGSSGSQVPGHA